jgi:hypothetical protein
VEAAELEQYLEVVEEPVALEQELLLSFLGFN